MTAPFENLLLSIELGHGECGADRRMDEANREEAGLTGGGGSGKTHTPALSQEEKRQSDRRTGQGRQTNDREEDWKKRRL
jgi:hypothetical protein